MWVAIRRFFSRLCSCGEYDDRVTGPPPEQMAAMSNSQAYKDYILRQDSNNSGSDSGDFEDIRAVVSPPPSPEEKRKSKKRP
jgi:hypothetical protein